MPKNTPKKISGFTIVMTILVLIFGAFLIFVPTTPPPPLASNNYQAGNKVLVKDCGGWVEATVISTDGQNVFVKGNVTEGNCIGIPIRHDAIVETTQDRLKKL